MLNSQNDRFYVHKGEHKIDANHERLYHDGEKFPSSVMVSVAVSKLGKTSLHFVEHKAKVNGAYYREHLLAQLIPEMNRLARGTQYIFQQDGARAHTARATIDFLNENVPELLPPDMWPPCSPDCNPVDYNIWSSLEQRVYRVKIRDLDHLCERLQNLWEDFPQQEIDAAIDQFRPRLRKMIEEKGKKFEHLL